MKDKDGYKNISGVTNREDYSNIKDESLVKINEDRPKSRELVESISHFKPQDISLKSVHLNMNPVVLQNPHMQMYNSFTNYSVCPFCKYSGAMIIEYKTSSKQKSCCLVMSLCGLFLCAWVPFLVKDCSDQTYKCPNCQEDLQTLPANKVTY